MKILSRWAIGALTHENFFRKQSMRFVTFEKKESRNAIFFLTLIFYETIPSCNCGESAVLDVNIERENSSYGNQKGSKESNEEGSKEDHQKEVT